MGWERSGETVSFKILTKPFGVPEPDDSEGLRARLKLMGDTFMFLRLKFPQKGVLASATKDTFETYTEYLFGDQVWNFTIKGAHGEASSCPHQDIVHAYDLAMREEVAKLMSEGVDIDSAFDQAQKNDTLKHTAFLCYFTIESGSARCRALSAPGFKDIHGMAKSERAPTKRALENGDTEQLSKSQKRARAKAKAKAKLLAITNGAPQGGPGQGKKGGKQRLGQGGAQAILNGLPGGAAPGGKGKGKGKLKTKMTTGPNKGLGICYAFANGSTAVTGKCKENPCPWAHACQICEGDHPNAECPNK